MRSDVADIVLIDKPDVVEVVATDPVKRAALYVFMWQLWPTRPDLYDPSTPLEFDKATFKDDLRDRWKQIMALIGYTVADDSTPE